MIHKNTENIEIVVALLKKHNIKHIVISPGGTNIAFVKAVQDDAFFKCYSVVDERSAMYFAIGLYLQTGMPIATSCTSAQATRNYLPGLTEAFYKHCPILAITMSKHPRFTYQDYMQAPDQTSLPKDSIKASYMLPFLRDENDYLHSVRVANEAMLELTHVCNGPVQLNIPWLDFPLDENHISECRVIKRLTVYDNWDVCLKNKKILLVIGEHRPFSESSLCLIEKFCTSYNVAVYVNHLSNYTGKNAVYANLLLSAINVDMFEDVLTPDIIILMGGQTGDYPLFHRLSSSSMRGVEVWRIASDGMVVDTYDKLSYVFECSEDFFFRELTSHTNTYPSYDYFNFWRKELDKLDTNLEIPFSCTYTAQKLGKYLPPNSYLQLSILNSLRNWNLFPLDRSIKCFSNVGAFGIDGGMSTFIGVSMETEQLCFLVIGDLAFLYDMNSIAIRHIKNNVRILLVNNNGGIEFKYGKGNNADTDRFIAAANHFRNAEGWAETCGFLYIKASSKNEFDNKIDLFVHESERPILFEVFVSDTDEVEAYRRVIKKNRITSVKYAAQYRLKHILK